MLLTLVKGVPYNTNKTGFFLFRLYLHGVIYLVDEVGVDKEVVKEECCEFLN